MFKKKLPRCASVASVVGLSTISTVGIIFNLLSKAPDIIKTANKVKDSIDSAKIMADNMVNQMEQQQYEEIQEDIVEEVTETVG